MERDADETPDVHSTAWKTMQLGVLIGVLIDTLMRTLIAFLKKRYRVKNYQNRHQSRP